MSAKFCSKRRRTKYKRICYLGLRANISDHTRIRVQEPKSNVAKIIYSKIEHPLDRFLNGTHILRDDATISILKKSVDIIEKYWCQQLENKFKLSYGNYVSNQYMYAIKYFKPEPKYAEIDFKSIGLERINAMAKNMTWGVLYYDVMLEITKYLRPIDAFALAQTCRSMYCFMMSDIIRKNLVWRVPYSLRPTKTHDHVLEQTDSDDDLDVGTWDNPYEDDDNDDADSANYKFDPKSDTCQIDSDYESDTEYQAEIEYDRYLQHQKNQETQVIHGPVFAKQKTDLLSEIYCQYNCSTIIYLWKNLNQNDSMGSIFKIGQATIRV